MNTFSTIAVSAIVLAGGAYGIYLYEKKSLMSRMKRTANLNVLYVKDWISSQDLENYNKSYTAVLLRGSELPSAKKLKYFFDISKIAALCVYDKQSQKVVKREYVLCEIISDEFGSEEFIEFPFEM